MKKVREQSLWMSWKKPSLLDWRLLVPPLGFQNSIATFGWPMLRCLRPHLRWLVESSTWYSVLGRILSKFRCSMNSETLEENLLGYYCLREEGKKATLDERVRQKMSDRQVTTLEALDLEDLKDIF